MIVRTVDPAILSEAKLWDGVVPASRPDLRISAILGANRSGLLIDPRLAFVCTANSLQPVAIALDQYIEVRGQAIAGPANRHPLHEEIFRMRVVAPAIPSGLCGVAFHCGTSSDERRRAFQALLLHFSNLVPPQHLQMAWDFPLSECEDWADGALENDLDFFRVLQGYGFTFLIDPGWRTIDDCIKGMRSRYRTHQNRWIRRADAAGLAVSTARCIEDWISSAAPLIEDVTTRQGIYYEIPTAEFLKEFAQLPGAEMTICSDLTTKCVRGVNLLLHGGDALFNLYVGFRADDHVAYQALLRYSVARAIELACRYLHLGQRADLSKRRLGALSSRLFLYARHPSRQIHTQLRNIRTPAGLPHEEIQPLTGYRRIFRREQRIRFSTDQRFRAIIGLATKTELP